MASEPVRLSQRYRFSGDFELDAESYTLRHAGRVLKLERIPMEILLFLADQRGRLVTREQIVEKIWGQGVFLDTDNGINGAIRKIRQALKDDPEAPRFIETVSGKGYRFIAPVETGAEPEGESAEDGRPGAAGEARLAAETASDGTGYRRWLVLAGVVTIAIGMLAAGIRWSRTRARLGAETARPMLAILPFTNLTGDAAQEYFSDGLTEEMISQLGSLDPQHLGVIGRTSVMHYKNTQTTLSQIGHELGVQYVLEGSVRRDAGRVRIAAQLIQVSDQSHLWSHQYDRQLTDLLAVQSEIAEAIANGIKATLPGQGSSRAARREGAYATTTSYEAYDLYLQGRYFWNKRTGEGFQQAAVYFQRAIETDPNYARAYAGLADTYGLMSTWYVVPQNEFMPKARAAAERAVEIDQGLPEAHASLGLIAENYDYDWARAEKEFRRAIELNPQYATAHQWYAEFLAWQGRFEEAFAESEQARQLDPMSLIIATDHAALLYYSRQYDRAIAQCRAVLDMDPSFEGAGTFIARSYEQEGKYAEALAEIDHWRRHWTWAERTYVYSRWGRTEEARQSLAKFEKSTSPTSASRTAASLLAYLGIEGHDQFIARLERAYTEHSNAVVVLKAEPMYDPLRGDPRFKELLHRLALGP